MKKILPFINKLFILVAAIFLCASASFASELSDAKETPQYMDNQVLVTFEKIPDKSNLYSISNDVNAQSIDKLNTDSQDTSYLITLNSETSVQTALKELNVENSIVSAQPNYLYSLDTITENSLSKKTSGASSTNDINLWNLKMIDTQQAWNLVDKINNSRSPQEKITVAVLDTGVNLNHKDLQTALNKEKCVTVVNQNNPESYPLLNTDMVNNGDDGGHGTMVSGILAATSGNGGIAGVAAGNHNNIVELSVIDVYSYYVSGSGRLATSSDIIKGINYACDIAGAKVINMSLGHYPNQTGDSLLKNAIHTAVTQKNATIVCSAGNKNSTATWLPSDFNDCISVISTVNYTDVFSNCKAPSSNYGWKKDICAPGQKVSTTHPNGGYTKESSGTSLAAPVVSGVAAMLYYVNPSITSSQVKNILTETATDLYIYGDDIYTRYGNVNALAAVSKAAGYPLPAPEKIPAPTSIKGSSSGYNNIKLRWKKCSSAKGYQIYRATSPNGPFTRIKTIPKKNTTSYTDSGKICGKYYYYKIRSYGTLNHKRSYSNYTKIVKARAVPAATSHFNAYSKTYKQIKLKWTRVPGASGYQLYRATSKNGKYKYFKNVKKGRTTSYITSSKLKAGRTYYFKLRAYRTTAGKHIHGTFSKVSTAKAVPAKPHFSAKKSSSNTITLSWKKVPKVDGYILVRATSKNGKYKYIQTIGSSSPRSLVDRNLKKGRTYYYKMRTYKRIHGKRIHSYYTSSKKVQL